MARPVSTKLTYFPHDCNMRQDKALYFLCAKYKSSAPYAVYNIILESIFGSSEGYYLPWDEREIILLSDRIYLPVDDTKNIVNDTLSNELFNKQLNEKYKIITSKEIQRRYLRMCERRKSLVFIKEYLLINIQSELENTGDYKNNKKVEKLLSGIRYLSVSEHANLKNDSQQPVINFENEALNGINVTLTQNNATLSTQSKSKSKIESINTTYSAIFENENFDEIFPAYKKFILTNNTDRNKEIENLKLRQGGASQNPELYNAITDCLNWIKNNNLQANEGLKRPDSIEEIKERLTSRQWQENVCMTMSYEPESFMDFTHKWIVKKELSGYWNYPFKTLKELLIDDYKKEIENGTRKNNRGNSTGNNKPGNRNKNFQQEEF